MATSASSSSSNLSCPEIQLKSDQPLGDPKDKRPKHVFKGTFGSRSVAVKAIFIQKEKQQRQIKSEIDALINCEQKKHNVIRLYSYSIESRPHRILLALELCKGSLCQWVTDKSFRDTFPKVSKLELLHQTINGLAHVHNRRIIHRGLKPENILLAVEDNQVVVKLSDFGLSKFLADNDSSAEVSTVTGVDTRWSAPEVLRFVDKEQPFPVASDADPRQIRTSRASDIFSLGCVFFFVATDGEHPFGVRPSEISKNILDNQSIWRKQEDEVDLPRGIYSLIKAMINGDRTKRPTASNVLNYHIFWSARTTLQFLIDVSNLSVKNPETETTCDLLETRYNEKICGGNENWLWLDHLNDTELKTHLTKKSSARRNYEGKHVMELIRVMRNLYMHWKDQPDNIKKKIPDPKCPEKVLEFWISRFPSLVHYVWMAFQDMEGELPDGYYPQEKYKFIEY